MGRVCTSCKEYKTSENFHKSPDKADGLHSWCKECERLRQRKYDPDPEITEKICRICNNTLLISEFHLHARNKDGYANICRACKAELSRISLYGVPRGWYDEQVEIQEGRCAICGKVKPLYVDHDHACCPGQYACGLCYRALLCDRCNRGLGFFDDDPDLLTRAVEYIDEHQPWRGGDSI